MWRALVSYPGRSSDSTDITFAPSLPRFAGDMRVVRTLLLLLAVACAVDGKSSAKMTQATKKLADVRIPEGYPPGVLPNVARRRRFRCTALVKTESDAPTFVVRGITADRLQQVKPDASLSQRGLGYGGTRRGSRRPRRRSPACTTSSTNGRRILRPKSRDGWMRGCRSTSLSRS
jgi:hypothetical protein